ncbi:hypothetical protein [Rheinheimera sp.]|uniref:hypothetical protein n=1 Tax=Rheinheimera sp. TaxID=1869214 RepID=UPI002734AB9D|nr:hypothetical protein [Rheinheimera sp.]MDP2714795.1 hypothetical protein [Rheinheimera sp.]
MRFSFPCRFLLIFSPLLLAIFITSQSTASQFIKCRDKNGNDIFTDDQQQCTVNGKPTQPAVELASNRTAASLTFTVSYKDPQGLIKNKTLYAENIKAAGKAWEQHLAGSATIEILVQVVHDNMGRHSAHSKRSYYVRTIAGKRIYEQGVAFEIRTGIDPNGAEPDLIITTDRKALDGMWLDEEPYQRLKPVAVGKIDSMSVFIHELGHALAFSGWLNINTQSSTENVNYSTYDNNIRFVNGNPYFTGPFAEAVYGGSVPLAFKSNSYAHIGDADKHRGHALENTIMNGIAFYYSRRYNITPLDLAIMHDSGVALNSSSLAFIKRAFHKNASVTATE